MDRFPSEFEDLLNSRGRKLLAEAPQLEALVRKKRTPILFFDGVIDRGVAAECVRLLDETMYPLLKRMYFPIPKEALRHMTENYSERLRKTVRVRTATMNSRDSAALRAARGEAVHRHLPASLLALHDAAGGAPRPRDAGAALAAPRLVRL